MKFRTKGILLCSFILLSLSNINAQKELRNRQKISYNAWDRSADTLVRMFAGGQECPRSGQFISLQLIFYTFLSLLKDEDSWGKIETCLLVLNVSVQSSKEGFLKDLTYKDFQVFDENELRNQVFHI